MKLILTAALYAAFTLAAEEPDWGKIVDAQSKPYNPHHPDHHDHSKHPSPVPEPATFLLVGASLIGAAMFAKSRAKKVNEC